MAYLDDHPPARSQFRCPRRADPSGVVVVHTAESTPDFVAFDGGAEAVARFIQTRPDPGSYHDLADSDSNIQLVRYECEAFHDATGSNPHSYGVSAATRADVWPLAPLAWRIGCVNQMAACVARYANWLKARRGIVIPARRITRDESELRIPGFISHAERDPARRTDPGRDFPWDAFLAEYARLTATPPPTTGRSTKVLDIATHPDGIREDLVLIATDRTVWHYYKLVPEDSWSPGESLGGQAKSIACEWSAGQFRVSVQGKNNQPWENRWVDTTGWTGWVQVPADVDMIAPADNL